MIKVSDVKKIMGEGFEFVERDLVTDAKDGEIYTEATNRGFCHAINTHDLYDDEFITEFAPRPNTGVQPVGDDVVVEVVIERELIIEKLIPTTHTSTRSLPASNIAWDSKGIISWKPCIKWLTEQSNIKTEEEIQAMGKSPYDVSAHCSDESKPEARALIDEPIDGYWQVYHGEEWTTCIRFGLDIHGNQAYQLSGGEFRGEFNADPEESAFRIKPIPTARDKAINMIAHEIDINHGMTSRQMAAVIYDAELLKEVK